MSMGGPVEARKSGKIVAITSRLRDIGNGLNDFEHMLSVEIERLDGSQPRPPSSEAGLKPQESRVIEIEQLAKEVDRIGGLVQLLHAEHLARMRAI